MDRDQLVAGLQDLLQQAADPDRDPRVVLEAAGLDLARCLAVVAQPTDVEALHLIGALHWRRYQALPDEQGNDDLRAALSAFARFLPPPPTTPTGR